MLDGHRCYELMHESTEPLLVGSIILLLVNTRIARKVALGLVLCFTLLRRSLTYLKRSSNELSDPLRLFQKFPVRMAIGACVLVSACQGISHRKSAGWMLLGVFCFHRTLKFRTKGRFRTGERLLVSMLHYDDPHWGDTLSTKPIGPVTEFTMPLISGHPGARRVVFAKNLGFEWFHKTVWGYTPVLRRGEPLYKKMDEKTRMLNIMTNTPGVNVFVLYPRGGWPKTRDYIGPGFVHLAAASGANLCLVRTSSLDEGSVLIDTVYINRADPPDRRPDRFEKLEWPPPKAPSQSLGSYLKTHHQLLDRIHEGCIDELIGTQCKVH